MQPLEYSADYIETTENIKRAMKLIEILDEKLNTIDALQSTRANETEAAKADRMKRLKFELSMQVPNMQALTGTARDLLAEEYQRLSSTTSYIIDKESEAY